MKKKLIYFIGAGVALVAIALTLVFLLGEKGYYIKYDPEADQNHWSTVYQMYQTSTAENDEHYCGLISGVRTGLHRKEGSLRSLVYSCTDDGMYFIAPNMGASTDDGRTVGVSYLFFVEHDSNTVIKLCGRPDCSHDTVACNAVLRDFTSGVSWYDSSIYSYESDVSTNKTYILNKMDPNGANRVAVLDCRSINQGQYTSFQLPQVQNGVFMVGMGGLDENGEEFMDWYYTKLDGSTKKLEKSVSGLCWNDGEAFLHGSFIMSENNETTAWELVQWDPDANTEHVVATLTDMDLYYGTTKASFWGAKNGLAHYQGQVLKINYPNCDTEVLFETGITEEHTTRFFPDCLAIYVKGENTPTISFYRYDGEFLGKAEINFPTNSNGSIIAVESRDRIYLRASLGAFLPTHYIDKSEFGSGTIQIHELQYPDLTEEEKTFIFTVN